MTDFASNLWMDSGEMMQDKVHYHTTCTLTRHIRQASCTMQPAAAGTSRVYIVTCHHVSRVCRRAKFPPGLSRRLHYSEEARFSYGWPGTARVTKDHAIS
jgi:hypothetical protein